MQGLLIAARTAALIGALSIPGLASAAACVSSSLSDYLGVGNCSIGALTLDQFSLFSLPTGATPIDTDAVTVTPITGASSAGLALTVADGLDAQAGDLLELLFGFRLTPVGVRINDYTLQLLGPTTVAADGVITGVQNLCVGAAVAADLSCAGTSLVSVVFDDGSSSESISSVPLATGLPIGVLLDLAVDGGLSGGASLGPDGGVSTVFTTRAVPEPSSLLASLLTLCILAGRSCRRIAVRTRFS